MSRSNVSRARSCIRAMRTLVLLALVASCSPRVAEQPEQPGQPAQPEQADPAPESPITALEPAPALALPPPPEPPPEPPPYEPFPDAGETVTVAQLLAALEAEVELVAAAPAVQADYEAFLDHFELAHDDALQRDYVRIKLAFEATRAGGLWGLRWDITNQEPQSDRVWSQWQQLELPGASAGLPDTTAVAECDELSALFAFVVHRIGLSKRSEVGLLWPTSNHVVAVWTLDRKSDHALRIVVPNSQIYLGRDESLGTDEFNPWRQKTIFDYRRKDAALDLTLPTALARAMMRAVHQQGARSQAELQQLRNEREQRQSPAPG